MRGAGAAESRLARPPSSRHLSGRFPIHEEAARSDAPKAATPPANRPSSALKSTGHLLIHDDLVAPDAGEIRDASPKPLTSLQSPARLSGRFQVLDNGSRGDFPPLSPRLSNAQQYSARLQSQDIETPAITKQEGPTRNTSASSRPSSAALRSGRLQVHDDTTSTSTQEIPAVSPSRSRPSSPAREQNDHHLRPPPSRNIPLSPIRQLSERIKLHDDGALASRQEMQPKLTMPALPTRQPSDRLQIHGDGAVSTKRNSSAGLPKEPVPMAPGAIDAQEPKTQGIKHAHDHHDDSHPSQSNLEHTSNIPDIPSTSAADEATQNPTSRFVPLHSQWTYGQRVFGRYKTTPYFYSGNIATYLGAGMFMVVFDDGTLDYRVRREDIMLREQLPPQSPTPSPQKRKQRRQSDQQDNSKSTESLRLDSFSGPEAGVPKDKAKPANSRRNSQMQQDEDEDENRLDPAVVPEHHLLPLQHVMVDFSVTPPREMILSFDDGGSYDGGSYSCNASHSERETWRLFHEDETLTMKRLECGVGYEDDSTQVSDSDESSEEDMSMTPWQQMTQTFGMGKATRVQRANGRRSSISSVSQVDRLSMTHKGMKQIPTPKSLKQVIADYFLRGNKKVQPSKPTEELALEEHVRLMEAKLNSMRSVQCTSGFPASTLVHRDAGSLRVVYERSPDGVRAYGTVTKQVDDGGFAVVTEDDQSISVEMVPKDKVDFLPSVAELEQQLTDLERTQRLLFAGQKVQVSLYPGSRFSGRGLITLEREYQTRFHVLLANRIRLVNVPADNISPLREKKKTAVTITEDQFLVCNKVKVYIGDQIYVKCSSGTGDLDIESSDEDEKLGLLNGVFSNRTAAVDFADGSTGYEVPPNIIFKCKRASVPADQDVRSLKNAVLMQASVAANGGAKGNLPVLEEGYQVKADHPRKAAVESCIVIKTHPSSACDLRFSDGTIAFEVFPSQMILDSVEQQRTHTKATSSVATNDSYNPPRPIPSYPVGDCVLAWSSRFGRYCSAKVLAKAAQDPTTGPGSISGSDAHGAATSTSVSSTLYTLAFDYGEYKTQMPADKITRLDDTTALLHTQRLTNYSIDTIGFELSRVNFTVGEAVMARVHGSARYFNGIVEAVNEKERICAVCFDSSERDIAVPFSAMFSVDSRSRFTGRSSSTKKAGSGGSSSSETASRARFLARSHVTEDTTTSSDIPTRPRRHSSGSVGNVLRSMDNFFRGSRSKPSLEPRRASHMITEIGARFRSPER